MKMQIKQEKNNVVVHLTENHDLIKALIMLKKQAPLSVNEVLELQDEGRK